MEDYNPIKQMLSLIVHQIRVHVSVTHYKVTQEAQTYVFSDNGDPEPLVV